MRLPEFLRSSMLTMGCGSSGGGGGLPPFPPFTPEVLEPLIWLDATQLVLGDGASVSSWTDMSGNGNHFVQGTGDNQPVFRASGINGIAAVEGDGTNDILSLASVAGAAAWWQLTVGQVVGFTGAGNAWSIDAYEPDGEYMLMQLNAADVLAVNASVGVPAPNEFPAGVGVPRAYLIEGGAGGLTVLADDGTSGTSALDFTKASAGMQLFGRGDGFNTNYRIGEFLYGTGVLTSELKAALWAYVADKWGTGTGV